MDERNVVVQEEGKMSPQEYFDVVKEKKHSIDGCNDSNNIAN